MPLEHYKKDLKKVFTPFWFKLNLNRISPLAVFGTPRKMHSFFNLHHSNTLANVLFDWNEKGIFTSTI